MIITTIGAIGTRHRRKVGVTPNYKTKTWSVAVWEPTRYGHHRGATLASDIKTRKEAEGVAKEWRAKGGW